MKKKKLKLLELNKKAISNLKGGMLSGCITTSNYWVPTDIYTEFLCNGDSPGTGDDNITIGSFCGYETWEVYGCK
ncbi:MAG: hypothetical protein AB8B65_04730 [Kordia sp.]|uniref:hypothetical protein n=1 Tax=Kordia sp. TaxID=1965332 RepID=UPI003859C86C